jgi:hypothetical protein
MFNIEFSSPGTAVDDHRDPGDFAAVFADEINRLLHPAAASNNVFRYQDFFAGSNFKTAFEDELIINFIRENGADAKRAGHFLPDNQAADRRGDYALDTGVLEFRGQFGAYFFRHVRILQEQRRLKETVAVQSAAEFKVPFQQGFRVFTCIYYFLFRH